MENTEQAKHNLSCLLRSVVVFFGEPLLLAPNSLDIRAREKVPMSSK